MQGLYVAVLSFLFWQRYFADDPAVIGRSLELNGWPHAIIGGLPNGFAANPMMEGMAYVPISPHVSNGLDNRRAAQFDLIGRSSPRRPIRPPSARGASSRGCADRARVPRDGTWTSHPCLVLTESVRDG
jgi:hypothetical protein